MESLRIYFDTLVDTVRHCTWVVQEQHHFHRTDDHVEAAEPMTLHRVLEEHLDAMLKDM